MIKKCARGAADWTLLVVALLVLSGAMEGRNAKRELRQALEMAEEIQEPTSRERSRMGRYLRARGQVGSVGESPVSTATKEGDDGWGSSYQDGRPIRSWR